MKKLVLSLTIMSMMCIAPGYGLWAQETETQKQSVSTEKSDTTAEVKFEDETYTVHIGEIAKNDEGNITVKLLGERINGIIPMRNGNLILPIGMEILAGGKTIGYKGASVNEKFYLYKFETSVMPERITVYGNDGTNKSRVTFDAKTKKVISEGLYGQEAAGELVVKEILMPMPVFAAEATMLASLLKQDAYEGKGISADISKEQKDVYVNLYSLLKCTADGKSIRTKTTISEWFATEKPVSYIIPAGSKVVFRAEKTDTGEEVVTAIKEGAVTIVFESGKKITIEANKTYNYKIVGNYAVIIP
jgi:hypothetical protein